MLNKKYNHRTCFLSLPGVFVFISLLLVSCEKKQMAFSADERRAVDSMVRAAGTVDSLALLQKRLEDKGDKLGSIVALREWGKTLRNESRFEEALVAHS